jgi:transposase InsO family protein
MPDIVTTDRGAQFTAREFELALSCHGIEQRFTAVESHHSLGANERSLHSPTGLLEDSQ